MKCYLFENQNGFQLTIKIELNFKACFGYFTDNLCFNIPRTKCIMIVKSMFA